MCTLARVYFGADPYQKYTYFQNFPSFGKFSGKFLENFPENFENEKMENFASLPPILRN